MNDEQVAPAVEAAAADAHQAVVQEVGGAAPRAVEPLPPDRVNSLAEVLAATIDEVGDGHLPPLRLEQVKGNQSKLPPDVFAPLASVFGFLQTLPEGAAYRVDVEQMSKTKEGLGELIRLLSGLRADQGLHRAIRRMGAQPPAGEAPAQLEAPTMAAEAQDMASVGADFVR